MKHAIVFTPEFQQSQIDQLANRLFSTKESRTKLLAERYCIVSESEEESNRQETYYDSLSPDEQKTYKEKNWERDIDFFGEYCKGIMK